MENISSSPALSTSGATSVSPVSNETVENEKELPPLKNFFGENVTLATVAKHSNLALQSQKKLEKLSNQPWPESADDQHYFLNKIKALNEQTSLHTFLAQEALQEMETHQTVSTGPIATQLAEVRREAEAAHSPESTPSSFSTHENRVSEQQTLLSQELPPSFISGREGSNAPAALERKQRQLLRAMTAHQKQAAHYERQVRRQKKMLETVKEYGSPERLRQQEDYVASLQEHAVYHLAMAQEIEAQIYGHDLKSPGAYQVVPQGGYELQQPVISPVPPVQAQKIKTPRQDFWRQLPRGRVVPTTLQSTLQAETLPALLRQGNNRQVPPATKATKVNVAKVEAESSTKTLGLPKAFARRL